MLVHANGHAELVLQIKELLLAIADDNRDVVDARLFELADLTLDQNLAANSKDTLRTLVRNRSKTGGHTRSHDDGVFHLVRLERFQACLGNVVVIEASVLAQRFDGGIHGTKRNPYSLSDFALGAFGLLEQRRKNQKLLFR